MLSRTVRSAVRCVPRRLTGRGRLLSTRAFLELEDGKRFEGRSFGAVKNVEAEVVFSTNQTGYTESMTDPSYAGQILTFTQPMVGNYGVPSDVRDEHGLLKNLESERIQTEAILVQDYAETYAHWQADKSLDAWLKEHNIPGVRDIDTRAVSRHLRENKTMRGRIVVDGATDSHVVPKDSHFVDLVSVKEPVTYGNGPLNIVAVDCGIKHNIIRNLVERGARVTVVPWDYDFTSMNYDGLFLSNGPGDPQTCQKTVEHIRKALKGDTPIFGICCGNQLMALAAGHDTAKLPYGNRGFNQPVVDKLTGRSFITSQNHGYEVLLNEKDQAWRPYFVNANDKSNEGIVHETKPFFSAQFHPEARCGPQDTTFLFDKFIHLVDQYKRTGTTVPIPRYPNLKPYKKVLVLGSGGLSIGQAGEFDYSGSQAIKSYKELGMETVLINSNIASIQTARGLADKVYYLPTDPETVERVIAREKPDCISLSFGGQTALNCGVELHDTGVLRKYNVDVLGTSIASVKMTEDRELFCEKLTEIGEPFPQSIATTNLEAAVKAAAKIGYPVICRAAYALGGLGSGFADNEAELRDLVSKAFTKSPQVLVEKDYRGWREAEWEVMRDEGATEATSNMISVTNMENQCPAGTHTGDSYVVAPSQSLTNDEFHMLRSAAFRIVNHLNIIGECNVQFMVDPYSSDYVVIECNPRLSRSSALASKATGYPIAAVAAKLGLGLRLHELSNAVTGTTTAAFEPALDYCVVKIPRWDLDKFENVSPYLGSGMKAVGEVMAIGRNYEEALQKGVRMVSDRFKGLDANNFRGTKADVEKELRKPTEDRVHAIMHSMYHDYHSLEEIYELCKVDRWFLTRMRNIVDTSRAVVDADVMDAELYRRAKKHGFSDAQIADRRGMTEAKVREERKALGVTPFVKMIDTVAGEFPAQTNYLYLTYGANQDDVKFDDNGIVVLGSGTYRIGSSVEFDYGSVNCAKALLEAGENVSIVNFNPETVSTDFDLGSEYEANSRLYFDNLDLETVLDITDKESPKGVVVSFGGQAPNNIALQLHNYDVPILGTHPDALDNCEDRERYSSLLDSIGVKQPEWAAFTSQEEAEAFCDKVGYGCLIRPSYVLSGAAMQVVYNKEELKTYLEQATEVSPDHPTVITKFIEGAKEIDVDCVAKDGELINIAVAPHIENGGVHSGDATLVLPPETRIDQDLIDKVTSDSAKIAKALNVTGPFNSQFLASPDGWVGVIETNMRASRSVPFCAKHYDENFVKNATLAMLGKDVKPCLNKKTNHVSMKVPQFSWDRVLGCDPITTTEMHSTGEVACYGDTVAEAYLQGLKASRINLPKKGDAVCVAVQNPEDAKDIGGRLGKLFEIVAADEPSAKLLRESGVNVVDTETAGFDLIKDGKTNFVFDVSYNDKANYPLRRNAVDYNRGLSTNRNLIDLLVTSFEEDVELDIKCYDEYNPPQQQQQQ